MEKMTILSFTAAYSHLNKECINIGTYKSLLDKHMYEKKSGFILLLCVLHENDVIPPTLVFHV